MVQQRALEESSRRLTAQLEATQEEQRKDRETLKVVLQQLASVTERAPGVADATQASIRASHFLQKMTTADDVEAYLTTFERTAERECWPKEQWAGLLAPFLSGEPQKAYFDLETRDAMDYGKLKKEILTYLGVTVSVRAQRVHTWVYSMDKPPRSQMHDLIHLTKKWLQPEVLTGPQMVEQVVMDQYLRSLPVTLRKWVSHGDPKDADQMVEMVERYKAAEELMRLLPEGVRLCLEWPSIVKEVKAIVSWCFKTDLKEKAIRQRGSVFERRDNEGVYRLYDAHASDKCPLLGKHGKGVLPCTGVVGSDESAGKGPFRRSQIEDPGEEGDEPVEAPVEPAAGVMAV
ncbi:uncharacterized protein PAF06_015299 [Gastrophryne carolinensis]